MTKKTSNLRPGGKAPGTGIYQSGGSKAVVTNGNTLPPGPKKGATWTKVKTLP